MPFRLEAVQRFMDDRVDHIPGRIDPDVPAARLAMHHLVLVGQEGFRNAALPDFSEHADQERRLGLPFAWHYGVYSVVPAPPDSHLTGADR